MSRYAVIQSNQCTRRIRLLMNMETAHFSGFVASTLLTLHIIFETLIDQFDKEVYIYGSEIQGLE
jgi:hypothetical protein